MKTCPRCWRTHDDSESHCRSCRISLVSKPTIKREFAKFESAIDKKIKQNLKRLAIVTGIFLLAIITTVIFVTYYMIKNKVH
jgi:hypothetical protein